MENKIELIAAKEFDYSKDMYKIVDFLNKNLQDFDVIVGLMEKEGKHIINLYKGQ